MSCLQGGHGQGLSRHGCAPRYFFHLYSGNEVIADQIGVEVGKLSQVPDAFEQTIWEMQGEGELNLGGWEVRVADAAGTVVETFHLSALKNHC
jgi:hypothetical protein